MLGRPSMVEIVEFLTLDAIELRVTSLGGDSRRDIGVPISAERRTELVRLLGDTGSYGPATCRCFVPEFELVGQRPRTRLAVSLNCRQLRMAPLETDGTASLYMTKACRDHISTIMEAPRNALQHAWAGTLTQHDRSQLLEDVAALLSRQDSSDATFRTALRRLAHLPAWLFSGVERLSVLVTILQMRDAGTTAPGPVLEERTKEAREIAAQIGQALRETEQ